jgi:hypothetical protein
MGRGYSEYSEENEEDDMKAKLKLETGKCVEMFQLLYTNR